MVCQIIDLFKDENIQMVYCSHDGQIREKLKEKKITFYPMSKLSFLELSKVIKEFQPDIIHAHDIRASVIATIFSCKIKVISHIHGNHEDMRKVCMKSLLFLLASIGLKKIIWVSNSAYNQYKLKSLIENKSMVLYNIINIDRLYERLFLDQNTYEYDVVYLGRLSYPKNPLRLITVLKLLVTNTTNIKIAIIGDGVLLDETKDYANKLGILENITFLGFVDNPLKILAESKVLIMTSIYEGTPMCALEAMALGVPIVSTPTDGMIDLILDNYNGFLSDNNTVLADKLKEIIEDSNLQRRLSSNTKEKIKKINDLEEYKFNINRAYFNI